MTWSDALDALEARLADQRVALAEGQPDRLAPFTPPSGLGPLPEELLPRALRLLDEQEALIAELTAARDAARAKVATTRPAQTRRARSTTTRPSVFDSRL